MAAVYSSPEWSQPTQALGKAFCILCKFCGRQFSYMHGRRGRKGGVCNLPIHSQLPLNRTHWSFKGSAVNVLVPDTTRHVQRSCGVRASADRACPSSTRGSHTILQYQARGFNVVANLLSHVSISSQNNDARCTRRTCLRPGHLLGKRPDVTFGVIT